MFKKTTFAVLALTIAATSLATTTASAGRGGHKDSTKVEELLAGEEPGGPFLEGGVSPYQARHRVCQFLTTPVYDAYSGEREYVRKKTCWFE